ncbi:MAG TPA: sigma-70 family RNA polymerase sigma factor [Bacteroidales bacterium]
MTEKNQYRDIHHELIKQCRKKDRKAQIEIYQLYYKAMYNTSLRIVNNSADAEDIMQESFLDAFSKLDMYAETGSFGSWLKRIVVNKSLDFLKSKKDISRLDDVKVELMEITDLQEEEKNMVEVDIQLAEVKQGMERLPGHYRVIVSLYLMEGYSHNEIARILNLSYENVRVRYIRAKKKLVNEIMATRNNLSRISTN